MKIGIVGTGNMGRVLGLALAENNTWGQVLPFASLVETSGPYHDISKRA